MKYDLLVFDLDGTLCDSAPDISASLRRTLSRMGREPISHEKVVAAIGSGVRKLIERTTTPPIEPVMDAFMKEYADHLLDATHLYSGVAETLERIPVRKPDPDCWRRAVNGAARPLMIGDSGTDVQTAKNGGASVVAVTYGYFKPGELDEADFRIDRFDQLLSLLR